MLNGLFFTLRLANNTGSFPRALTRDEEQEYLKRMAEGDDEARESDRFLARHSRGFHSHMSKLSGAGYNHGATVSCAM